VRSPAPSALAFGALLTLSALLGATAARADGSYPGSRQILLPADRPEQIILATNLGLIFSEDSGQTWLFSCEQGLSAYAGPYLLGGPSSQRIFAQTSGAGLIYSDDDSCSWQAARGALSDLLLIAFAVGPSSSQRVYALGAPRYDLRNGNSIYVSDDGGLSFGKAVFTSPPRSALLSVLVAPSQPSRLFAAMFATPENHPILLRSNDSGEHWEVAADLVESLGEDPFELLAIDPLDENRLYVRILGATAETLATSDDGGLSFVQSVSIPGKLTAFLKLASGTLLVAGTAGIDALGYRSRDDGLTFEPWPGAPHVHALAERNGKLYVAADNYADGYVIAESDDEGANLRPLTGFKEIQGVKSCVRDLCADSCAYYAGINLWPEAVCGAESSLPEARDAAGAGGAGAGTSPGIGGAPAAVGDDGPPGVDESDKLPHPRISGGGCACDLVESPPAKRWTWAAVLALGSLLLIARGTVRRGKRDWPHATA